VRRAWEGGGPVWLTSRNTFCGEGKGKISSAAFQEKPVIPSPKGSKGGRGRIFLLNCRGGGRRPNSNAHQKAERRVRDRRHPFLLSKPKKLRPLRPRNSGGRIAKRRECKAISGGEGEKEWACCTGRKSNAGWAQEPSIFPALSGEEKKKDTSSSLMGGGSPCILDQEEGKSDLCSFSRRKKKKKVVLGKERELKCVKRKEQRSLVKREKERVDEFIPERKGKAHSPKLRKNQEMGSL